MQYGLDAESGEVDYASVEKLASEHRPKLIMAGFSAYSRTMNWARFREIADSVGAYLVVDMLEPYLIGNSLNSNLLILEKAE